jgi:hypothetical protein
MQRLDVTGRPSRNPDPLLAEGVRRRMLETGVSMRVLAKRLEIDPATLSRSFKAEAFTRKISGRLIAWLGSGNARTDARLALHKVLQELATERKARSRVEAAVKLALDRLDSSH